MAVDLELFRAINGLAGQWPLLDALMRLVVNEYFVPTTMSLAGRVLAINGKVTSIFSSGSSLGTLFVPWLVGQYFESVGPQVLTTLLMVDLGVALGVYALLTRKIKHVEAYSQGSGGQ